MQVGRAQGEREEVGTAEVERLGGEGEEAMKVEKVKMVTRMVLEGASG